MTSIPSVQEGGMPQRKELVTHSRRLGEYGKVLRQPEVDPPVAGEGAVHPGTIAVTIRMNQKGKDPEEAVAGRSRGFAGRKPGGRAASIGR